MLFQLNVWAVQPRQEANQTMKKKLILKKEALKNLTPVELDHVAGGVINIAPNDVLSVPCNSL